MNDEEGHIRRRFSEAEREEIVDEVYDRFYRQVGNSAIRCALYIFWSMVAYAAYYLAQRGWLGPGK